MLVSVGPCSQEMMALYQQLAAVSWADAQSGATDSEAVVKDADLATCVSAEVATWTQHGINGRELLCHETTTHLKWFVAYSAANGVVMWIHQYKPNAMEGYARTIHNHRYWFVSAILYGGYDHLFYDVASGQPQLRHREQYRAPGTYVMDADSFHSLESIVSPTLTLIVQGPAVRSLSQVFSHSDGRDPTSYPDFNARTGQLVEDVARQLSNSTA